MRPPFKLGPVFAMDAAPLRTFLARLHAADVPAEAITARDGQPRQGMSYARDGVAVIPVVGPMVWHDDWFFDFLGIRTYEGIAREYSAALEDPSIHGILFHVDSPGGEALGLHELGEMVYAGREKKRTWTYTSGDAASGGYWLASSTEQVIADRLSRLGSIGVLAVYLDDRKWMEEMGFAEIVIVSEQSPQKFTDPATQEGFDRIKATLTGMADVFGDAVARNRGTTKERVFAEYGKGWVKLGQEAAAAGLADRLGSFEGVLAEMAAAGRNKVGFTGAAARKPTGGKMEITRATLAEHNPELLAALIEEGRASATATLESAKTQARAEGATADRERITAILALGYDEKGQPRASVRGYELLVMAAVSEPATTRAEVALRVLEAREAKETAAAGATLAAIQGDEKKLEVPGPGAHAGVEGGEPSTLNRLRAAGDLRKAKSRNGGPSKN